MDDRSKSRALGVLIGVGLSVASCSPLRTFNALVPKDGASVRVATGVAYASGPREKLDIYAPREDEAGSHSRPVVVFFYGGSWDSGTRSGYGFVGRALAARGFVVVIPDYRLVPNVRYPAFVEDGAAAVRWTEGHVAQYGGDPDKLVLAGHSAGGYIAAMLAVDDRWLGASRSAVRGFIGLAGPYDFTPFDVAASRAAFGAWPKPDETQPVTWAGRGDLPTLLLVGSKDRVVEPRNSKVLAARLRTGGVSVELKSYPGVGHVGLVTSLAQPFRGRSSALNDMSIFIRRVTN